MSRSFTLGHYIPGESVLHGLNPRFKLLNLLIILAALFWLRSFPGIIAFLLFFVMLTVLSGVPLGYLFRGLRPVIYIIVFTLLIYFFFTKGGVVLLRLGPVTVEEAGVAGGLFVTARLVGLVLATLLVTLTTTPLAMTGALEFFMNPLRRIGLPVAEIAIIMTIALRFIPTLMEESQRLMRAQMARGADFETGNLFRKAKKLTPLIVPLFVSAFRRADELAVAMEARGFSIGLKRTRMREEKVTALDWSTFIFSAAVLAAVIVFPV